jgi:vacuolar-type H+-ATPase subunit D/Vma8
MTKPERIKEQLKDARAYRQTLIEKRGSLEAKLAATEARIKKLTAGDAE